LTLPGPLDTLGGALGTLGREAAGAATALRVFTAAGVLRPYPPLTVARLATAAHRWGLGPAGGFAMLALRNPDGAGLVDELGQLTFGEIDARGNALAHALRNRGVRAGDAVAVLCRNHRYLVDATAAASKLGADVLYLNTAFSGPQLAELLGRERPMVVVHDEEFGELLVPARGRRSGKAPGDAPVRVLGWTDDPGGGGVATVEELVADAPDTPLQPPSRPARIVMLTSGTTGSPKGAPRSEAGVEAAVAILSRLPLRRRWRTHIAAPLFHTWGWAHLALSMLLESTVVLRRRFEPEACLRVVSEQRCDSLVVIPVMLQRMLRLPPAVLDAADLSRCRVVASSGSALPGDLAVAWMDRFGDRLYNLYGSTEVAYATVADPADLRAAPGTAGRPPANTVVRLYDEHDRPLPPGGTGRIFVGNTLLFGGYTGGGGKAVVDGLMSTGDVGRFDDAGRLFVEGRDDEMIVSGGENVFPQEVEDCLTRHPAVVEAAAVGVPDAEFGQRLRAFVVPTGEGAATAEDLQAHVKAHLAGYKVPRDVVFLGALPRNETGKVLKRELAARQAGGADR
jgi:fatty-acyl-CoA synthase